MRCGRVKNIRRRWYDRVPVAALRTEWEVCYRKLAHVEVGEFVAGLLAALESGGVRDPSPPEPTDVERLNRAADTMLEQTKNLGDVLGVRGSGVVPSAPLEPSAPKMNVTVHVAGFPIVE